MGAPPSTLSDAERLDWIRLARTENVGPIVFRGLLQRYGSAGAALQALPALAQRGGRRRPLRTPSTAEAERELAGLARLGGRLIALGEPGYPAALAAIDDAPPLLAVLGRVDLLDRPTVGVVGARNASLNGRRLAGRLAGELGQAGWVVASGFARGIDAAAHEGSLASGTVGVLAGGVDVVYPPEHRDLHRRIAEAGALISECPLGTQPTAHHFPRRNRLISGLSLGLVVVEAAPRSGSLITARMAVEQGRTVFAVPGSPLDPRAQGCNDLIRTKGATLIQSAADVLEDLEPQFGGQAVGRIWEPTALTPAVVPPAAAPADGDALRDRLLGCLGPSPTPLDEIIRATGAPAAEVLALLLDLELAGRLQRHAGNQLSLIGA